MRIESPLRFTRPVALLLVIVTAWWPIQVSHARTIAPQATQIQRSRPFPATQYVPDHDYDTKHIALDLHFDWERERLIGRETLMFSPLVNNLREVQLDAANMNVGAVKLSPSTQLQFNVDTANQKLNITLDRPYQPADTATLLIDYQTNGSTDRISGLVGGGLRFIKPTPSSGTTQQPSR